MRFVLALSCLVWAAGCGAPSQPEVRAQALTCLTGLECVGMNASGVFCNLGTLPGTCDYDVCVAGFGDCDGDRSNGCETNTDTSTSHCGACGKDCSIIANATVVCLTGTCDYAACAAGFGDCDGDRSNGCETNTNTSGSHCGACGNDCPLIANATVACTAGTCDYATCAAGFGDCDGARTNGCETNTNTSTSHCGTCGNDCPLIANATVACAAGTCDYAACAAGFGDCDGDRTNGCETTLATSVEHCGACNADCDALVANATGKTCSASTCDYAACAPGFADCDGNRANGCETNLETNADHCGACGRTCSGANVTARACSGGLCTSSCAAGFGNCASPAAPAPDDGCETSTATSTAHCGACNRACAAANTAALLCAGGVCTSTCTTGFGNCGKPLAPAPDDGCETSLTSDVDRCGSCFISCPPPTNACQARACASSTCGYVSTGAAGCCNPATVSADCHPNVCQNAACSNNQCVLTAKTGVSGCCTQPSDCPAQPNPCVENTCIDNLCGTLVVPSCTADLGAFDLSPPPDLAGADLAGADLSDEPDLGDAGADLGDGAAQPDLAGVSLAGGAGCSVVAPGGRGGAFVVVVLLLAVLLRLRRRAEP